MPETKESVDSMTKGQIKSHVADHVHEADHAAHANQADDRQEHGRVETADLIRIALTAVIAALVWFRVWEPFPRISLLGITGILIGGYPIFREALENIRERRMTMELSMTIALLSALASSWIIFFKVRR